MRREPLGNSDPAFVDIYVDYSFWEHLGNILTDGVNLKGRLHCFLVLLYERISTFLPSSNHQASSQWCQHPELRKIVPTMFFLGT